MANFDIDKLKPCPFCGKKPVEFKNEAQFLSLGVIPEYIGVACCAKFGGSIEEWDDEKRTNVNVKDRVIAEVTERWNTRWQPYTEPQPEYEEQWW